MKKFDRIYKTVAIVSALAMTVGSLTACSPNSQGGSDYTIAFNSNGGATIEDLTFKAGDNVSLPVPERPGYTFAGWYSNEMLTGNPLFSLPDASAGNKEFWAAWTEAEYNITYKDGTRNLTAQSGWVTKYKDADAVNAIALPTSVEKDGYTFIGWYTNADLTGDAVTEIPAGSTGDKTFWSKWDAVEYTVTYVTNIDGYEIPQAKYTTVSNLTLATPEAQQYRTFDGWYETPDFSTRKLTQINRGTTGDKTLYGKWNGEEYDITYNLNGGSFTGNYPQKHVYGTATRLVAPEKADSTFAGWYDNAEFTGDPVTELAADRHEGITLYARFSDVDFTISYELDGGRFAGVYPQGFKEGETVELVAPVKDGYTFAGWFETADKTGTAVTTLSGKTDNVQLYAKWTLEEYTITYELNGGALGGRQTTSYNVESGNINLTSNAHTPTRTGYVFDGWYSNAEFIGENVRRIASGSTGNKTLYAKWTIEQYVVRYELSGGSLGVQSTSVQFTVEDAVPLPATDPTRNGYTFAGWFTDAEFTTAAQPIPVGTTGSKTVYAKWNANTYTITYDANGGTMPTGEYATEYVTNTDTIWLPVPTLSGKVFGGWYEASENVTAPDTNKVFGAIRSKDFGNKEFKALWLDSVLSSNQSQLMEAENTDLTGKTGPGGSGSASEGNMISTQYSGASGGKCIPWTRGPGVSIDWEFTLDREVSNGSVRVRFGSEIGDVTFDNKSVAIYVNGVLYTNPYSVSVPNMSFADFTISGVALRAGYNKITIEVLKNDLAVGFEAGGPMFDCITVTVPAAIDFKPIEW